MSVVKIYLTSVTTFSTFEEDGWKTAGRVGRASQPHHRHHLLLQHVGPPVLSVQHQSVSILLLFVDLPTCAFHSPISSDESPSPDATARARGRALHPMMMPPLVSFRAIAPLFPPARCPHRPLERLRPETSRRTPTPVAQRWRCAAMCPWSTLRSAHLLHQTVEPCSMPTSSPGH